MNIPEEAVTAAARQLALRNMKVPWRGDQPPMLFFEDARAALSAAAPTLMAREVVRTVQEVRALPDGSVVIDATGVVATRLKRGWAAASPMSGYIDERDVLLPATVIH